MDSDSVARLTEVQGRALAIDLEVGNVGDQPMWRVGIGLAILRRIEVIDSFRDEKLMDARLDCRVNRSAKILVRKFAGVERPHGKHAPPTGPLTSARIVCPLGAGKAL